MKQLTFASNHLSIDLHFFAKKRVTKDFIKEMGATIYKPA